MNRLIEYTVPRGLVIAWRFAGSPTRISPLDVNATTDGVSRLPSWLGITVTSEPSITATTLLVVPRSIPMSFSPSATTSLLSHVERRCEARAGPSPGRLEHEPWSASRPGLMTDSHLPGTPGATVTQKMNGQQASDVPDLENVWILDPTLGLYGVYSKPS